MSRNLKKSCSEEEKWKGVSSRSANILRPIVDPATVVCDRGSERLDLVGERVMTFLECTINKVRMLGYLRNIVGEIKFIVEKCGLKNSRLIEYEDLVQRLTEMLVEDYNPAHDKSQDDKEMFFDATFGENPIQVGLEMLQFLEEFIKNCWVPLKSEEAFKYFEDLDPEIMKSINLEMNQAPGSDLKPASSFDVSSSKVTFRVDSEAISEHKITKTYVHTSTSLLSKFYKKQDIVRGNQNISREYLAHICKSILRELSLNECLRIEVVEDNHIKPKYLDFLDSLNVLTKICEQKLATGPIMDYARKLYVTYSCNRIFNYSSILSHLKTYKMSCIKVQKEILNSIDQQLREMHLNKGTTQKLYSEGIARIKRDAQLLIEAENQKSIVEDQTNNLKAIFEENRKKQWEREKHLLNGKVKLDEDIYYIQNQYEEVTQELERNLEETRRLQDEHNIMQAELNSEYGEIKKVFDVIMNERFWTEHNIGLKEETIRIRSKAATQIQTWWRNYRVKKLIRKKSPFPISKKQPGNRNKSKKSKSSRSTKSGSK